LIINFEFTSNIKEAIAILKLLKITINGEIF